MNYFNVFITFEVQGQKSKMTCNFTISETALAYQFCYKLKETMKQYPHYRIFNIDIVPLITPPVIDEEDAK